MTVLSASQLEIIRQRPQQTKLHLSLFSPATVLACQVTGTVATGDRTISYYATTTGSFSNIESGMTLLLGSAPGGFDLGRIRVKSATATTLTVAENTLAWSVGKYLTVLKYWEVWPVFPRIIHDPADDENVIFYKDYDIAYTNQNSILGTFVCSGPHRASYIDNGVAALSYTSSGTHNLLGNSVGHYWSFEGGTPSTFAGAEPGLVQYTTPGHYVTKHTVTGSNGCSDTSYRYVSVYQRPSSGSQTTIQDFTVDSIDGSRDSGGYTSRITIHQTLNNPIIPGTVVVLFAENMYNNALLSIGGNSPGSENIFFVGYVLDGTINYDYEKSKVTFSVGSVTELMKIAEGFSISVQDKVTPATWFELLRMDCRRALYHFLRWHSTVLSVTDFQFVGTDYPIQYFDADRSSLYDAISGFLSSTLVGEVVADRQGKIWAEVSAKAVPTVIPLSGMTVTKRDWMGEPSIKEQTNEKSSYVEMGGIAYSGAATGTFSALMACAPGAAPAYRGKAERSQGLALASQNQLNTLVGNVFANKNNRFLTIDMDMSGNFLNLDIAPQELSKMSIAREDTQRNVQITGSYLPSAITWSFDGEDLLLIPRIGWENISSGQAGETITIPDIPPGGGYSPPPFNIPGLTLPPFTFPPVGSSSLPYFRAFFESSATYNSASDGLPILFYTPVSYGTPIVTISGSSFFTSMDFVSAGLYAFSYSTSLQVVNFGLMALYPGLEISNLISGGDKMLGLSEKFTPGVGKYWFVGTTIVRIPSTLLSSVKILLRYDGGLANFNLGTLLITKLSDLS